MKVLVAAPAFALAGKPNFVPEGELVAPGSSPLGWTGCECCRIVNAATVIEMPLDKVRAAILEFRKRQFAGADVSPEFLNDAAMTTMKMLASFTQGLQVGDIVRVKNARGSVELIR